MDRTVLLSLQFPAKEDIIIPSPTKKYKNPRIYVLNQACNWTSDSLKTWIHILDSIESNGYPHPVKGKQAQFKNSGGAGQEMRKLPEKKISNPIRCIDIRISVK